MQCRWWRSRRCATKAAHRPHAKHLESKTVYEIEDVWSFHGASLRASKCMVCSSWEVASRRAFRDVYSCASQAAPNACRLLSRAALAPRNAGLRGATPG
eukprot:scaffold88735_cov28-Tisochrysis_lutea.AAC.6